MRKDILILRFFLWLILAIIVGWLIYLGVVPGGRISYVYDFSEPGYFIRNLTPAERIEPPAGGAPASPAGRQKIIGDPVYFTLRTPRTFNTARLTVKFKNDNDFSVIEAGVLSDKTVWRYQMRPLQNKVIENLTGRWLAAESDGLMLLQRRKRFDTVAAFLNDLPPDGEVAVYNYEFDRPFLLADYEAASGLIIDQPLRGPHRFYTYIKDEPLDFEFKFLSLNRNKDRDAVELKLYRGDELIAEKQLADIGNGSDDKRTGETKRLVLSRDDLAEGMYKIDLDVNDDIVTKSIKTRQHILTILAKVWLADDDRSDLKLYTDSRQVVAETTNPAKLQTIEIAGRRLKLAETYRQFGVSAGGGISEIRLPKDDVIIAGDGVFSFSSSSLINPNLTKAVGGVDLDREGINYILARYRPAKVEEGWLTATAEFDLRQAYREDGKYNFLISIPGLKAEAADGRAVEVGEIRIDLLGTTLWGKIRTYLKNL